MFEASVEENLTFGEPADTDALQSTTRIVRVAPRDTAQCQAPPRRIGYDSRYGRLRIAGRRPDRIGTAVVRMLTDGRCSGGGIGLGHAVIAPLPRIRGVWGNASELGHDTSAARQ